MRSSLIGKTGGYLMVITIPAGSFIPAPRKELNGRDG
jgi:hypothetical protein